MFYVLVYDSAQRGESVFETKHVKPVDNLDRARDRALKQIGDRKYKDALADE